MEVRFGAHQASPREIGRAKVLVRFDSCIGQGRQPQQIPLENQPKALLENAGQVPRVLGPRELPKGHQCIDVGGIEPGQDARHPRVVALGGPTERRVRVLVLPALGIEVLCAEIPELLEPGCPTRALPGSLGYPEGDEVCADVAPVEDVRFPEAPRNLVPVPFAAERVARVEVVMTDDAGRRVDDLGVLCHPHVHRVLLAGIEVVQPGGDEPCSAKLAPVFVRDHVVGVVGAGALVAERPEKVPGQPRAGLHAIEISRPGRLV